MSETALRDILGGEALIGWLGRVPRFHDAKLLNIAFSGGGSGLLRIHTWDTTNEVDARGYFILEKHVVVVINLEAISAIDCVDFDMVPGIILDLEITRLNQSVHIQWDASYGVSGSITAKRAHISFQPGEPSQS